MSKLFMSLMTLGFVVSMAIVPRPIHPLQEQVDEEKFTDAQIEFFETKVRPLLVEHCYDCHGPDADPPEGGLSLVSRKAILAGGDSGPGIDLNDLATSNVLSAIEYGDLFQMPPDSKLEKEQVEILRKWIMDKAPWPADSDIEVETADEFDLEKRKAEHWCWQPINRSSIPKVQNEAWPLDPIDHFILAKLEGANLNPAEQTDRRTWLRRVTFDITGMPPTIREIEEFLADKSQDAFANVVDRLLASSRYGERWARHWMDLVRYAETCGHEFDYPIPNAYQYRDYLIRAFNADVPYNDFVVEHIAGDLTQQPRRNPKNEINESILGTGFWFLGEATHAPVDVKGDEAGRVDNQIDVMGKTFLGLTIACARCHDHKFDAISDEDYYGIAGFLQSSRRQNAMLDPHRKIEAMHARAADVSSQISNDVDDFIQSLDDQGDNFLSYGSYIRSAILFLKQDQSWMLPERMVLEAEAFPQTDISSGNARRQDIQGWSGGGQIWWTDANVNDELELEFDAPQTGTYEILARFTKAPDYGIAQVTINENKVAQDFDLYAKGVSRSEELSLGKFQLEKGTQSLLFKIVGKNDDADPRYMVGLDYLVLKGDKEPEGQTDETARIESFCEQQELDANRLRNWVRAIKDPKSARITHPFYILRKSAESSIDLDSDDADTFYTDLFGQLKDLDQANQKWTKLQSEMLDSVLIDSLYDWNDQGFAFNVENRPFGQVNLSDGGSTWTDWNAARHSGLLGNKFQGVIRSETFEITTSNIYYLVNARNAEIRLVIDGFRMDIHNPLLFNDMHKVVDTGGEWKWIRQSGDLTNHIGHNAFIEIIDQGDGFVGIQEIRISDKTKPEVTPSPISVERHHHLLVDGNWHDARYNDGMSPLECIQESMALSLQASSMYRAADIEIFDAELFEFMLTYDLIPGVEEKYKTLTAKIDEAKERIARINDQVPVPTMAIGMVDGSPENEYVFIRGNHKNTGFTVSRAPITALNNDSWPDELSTSGRMELAQNIVSLQNPLTRRVIVNRIWHHLTGKGISASVDNFGVLGSKPTHPELLDYLANEFSDTGWSIKKLIRRIVLSQTYRMSSVSSTNATEADPNNDLLYKFRVRRLQGESIRDSMLSASGALNEKMYGPSVPIHLTSFMQGRGRPGKTGPLTGDGRRSIYIEVRRNFLSPMMLAFDTPIPFNSIGKRTNSNVPAQALILMNDPLVIELAKSWAERLIKNHEDKNQRLETAFETAIGRTPSEQELSQLTEFLELQSESYGDEVEEAKLWADLCHVLFNMKEFIYIK